MSNPYALFETNAALESGDKGVELDYGHFSINIHRAGGSNKAFARVFAANMKPHRAKYERGVLDDATASKILLETYAETVIVGWKGVKDRNDKKLAFNKENVIKLLTDLPELFADIQAQAADVANFKTKLEEIEIKN